MFIEDRAPSSAWEQLPLGGIPGCFVWGWFKPAGAPRGFYVQVPQEMYQAISSQQPLTMVALVRALGIEPVWIARWTLFGTEYLSQQGTNPAWNYPLPAPMTGVDSTIGIEFEQAESTVVAPTPSRPSVSTPVSTAEESKPIDAATRQALSQMDADWTASVLLERQLDSAAKQLNGTVARIGSMSRDLSAEESRFADQHDKKEWQEARRWMRDAAVKAAQLLKDHFTGMNSAVGKRTAYEAIYDKYVVPRRNFDSLQQSQRDFEMHRKALQTLLSKITAANGSAVQDAERRGQQIMTRIGAKIRAARAKR